jgi:tripartite-type tricarboxylate transporter receptor subunit TctC
MRFSVVVPLVVALTAPAAAETTYPAKPVRLVVPFPPGASNDTIARAVGQKLSESLAQQVVIDNRGGAGGSIGAAILARAPADGYTLMLTSTTYATSAAVQTKLPFDPVADVAGVAMIGRGPMMVVVTPSVPAQSIKELLAYARSQAGRVNYTSSGIGSAPHLATELFMREAGVEMVHVPYKGLAPAMTDLMSGRVQVLIASLPSVLSHVKADRLRGLAVTSAQRSAFTPGVPTVSESGVPDYVSELWWGLFAPSGTPSALIARLNSETHKAVASGEVKQLLATAGAEPVAMSAVQFTRLVADEIGKWRRVVQERGIKAE